MNIEAVIWTWLYMGIFVGVISLALVLWAIFYNKE